MTRSADRTAGNVDNATTFYLTNVVPQMGDLNQGVWREFENVLIRLGARRPSGVHRAPARSTARRTASPSQERGQGRHPRQHVEGRAHRPDGRRRPFTHGDVQRSATSPGSTMLAVNMPNVAGVRTIRRPSTSRRSAIEARRATTSSPSSTSPCSARSRSATVSRFRTSYRRRARTPSQRARSSS